MSKIKKAGKHRMNKNTLSLILEAFFRENPGRTFSFKEIFKQLKLNTHPLKMLAIEIMEEMAWDDFITRMSDNSYQLRQNNSQVREGIFQRKQNGRNSFLPDGEDKSILVTEKNSLFAMNGDRVRVTIMARRRGHTKEAQVIEIVERAKEVFVGRLLIDDDLAFVITREELASDIIVPKKKMLGARKNDKVVVKVLRWPDSQNRYVIAEVIDVLGRCGENDAEMNSILLDYGLPYIYPKEVEEAAEKISAEITEDDVAEREDFRDVFTCTIDPRDAKDFDDAISIRPLPESEENVVESKPHDLETSSPEEPRKLLFEVGVHIADVSHYVKEGSIIDLEAQKRATSVYLVDRTIPMLPERLCNYICSLRPDEDKLAYSVIFTIDEDANIHNYRIRHTVIRSNRRYVYDEVQAVIDASSQTAVPANPSPSAIQDPWAPQLLTLWQIARKLREKRFKNGAVKFESEEIKFELDKDGKPVSCYYKQQSEANYLVEEFMLLANRTVAEHVGKPKSRGKSKPSQNPTGSTSKGKTLPYRIHDNPDPQRLEQLKEFIVRFGYHMKQTNSRGETSRALNSLMDQCAGTTHQKMIQTIALRSMMKAKYSVHNIGHFGLAFDYYTHFTSPIRRYPDTMVHRLLTRYEQGAPSANAEYYEEQCKHSSAMEQLAANAERDSTRYKAVEFMSDKIGRKYNAHISGITSHGIYCEIDETHCEGMVHLSELRDDYYEFDEMNYCLRGWNNGNVYQLGDAVRIKVLRANLEKKQLDFVLA